MKCPEQGSRLTAANQAGLRLLCADTVEKVDF
jgi:hypothetical protein